MLTILVFAHLVAVRRALTFDQIAVRFLGDFPFTLFGCLLICSNNIMYTCLGIGAHSLIRAAADDDGGKYRV